MPVTCRIEDLIQVASALFGFPVVLQWKTGPDRADTGSERIDIDNQEGLTTFWSHKAGRRSGSFDTAGSSAMMGVTSPSGSMAVSDRVEILVKAANMSVHAALSAQHVAPPGHSGLQAATALPSREQFAIELRRTQVYIYIYFNWM